MRWGSPRFTWHRWFAWRPVRLQHGGGWVWLESVERWIDGHDWVDTLMGANHLYRLPGDTL